MTERKPSRATFEDPQTALNDLRAELRSGDDARVVRGLRRLPVARALQAGFYDQVIKATGQALLSAHDADVERAAVETALRAELARDLAEGRRRSGLTLREVARRVALAVPSVQQLEAGRLVPRSAALFAALADALELPSDWGSAAAQRVPQSLHAAPGQKERVAIHAGRLIERWTSVPDTRKGREQRRGRVRDEDRPERPQTAREALHRLAEVEPGLSEEDRAHVFEALVAEWDRLLRPPRGSA